VGLVLSRKKPKLEGEGIEGQCSYERTPLCRGNLVGKAFDKPLGCPKLRGERGNFVVSIGVKESNLPDPFLDFSSQL
jgi:hypothetical protein